MIIRLALAAVIGAAITIVALASAQVAQASDGWQLAERSTDSSRSWSTFVYVSGYEGTPTQARLRVTTSRRMRVKVRPTISCHDVDYVNSIRRELAPSYRWVGPRTPLVRTYGPTFAAAHSCYFSVSVTGGRGRLSASLETR
jgi:hypothetical protein